jgi:hypothetical protein
VTCSLTSHIPAVLKNAVHQSRKPVKSSIPRFARIRTKYAAICGTKARATFTLGADYH